MDTVGALDISLASGPFAIATRRNEIVSLAHQIREVFAERFDRAWMSAVIDALPLDSRTVREIREFLASMEVFPDNVQRIESGIDELLRYAWTLRKDLLPHAIELLGVSPFSSAIRTMDKSQYVLRRLTADTLPHNIAKLELLIEQLERAYKAA